MKQKISPIDFLNSAFLFCAITFFLLWPGTNGYANIAEAKFSAFLWIFGGYLICMTVLHLEQWLIGAEKPPKLSALWTCTTWTQRFVVLYWLLTVISTAVSPYRNEALLGMSRQEGLLTISIYCAVFLLLSATAKPKPWMLYVFGAVMTLEAALCLLQMQGYNPFELYPEGLTYFDANQSYAGVYLGTIGNADLMGTLLTLAIPLFWVGILRLKQKLRFLLILPLGLCAAVLMQMNVQAAIVGVTVGGLLSLPVILPKYKKQALFIVLAACVGGIVFAMLGKAESGTLYELGQVLRGNWDDKFGNGRIYIWRNVLKTLPEHLLFGTGPDTMATAGIQGLAWHSQELGLTFSPMIDTAHNEYLNIAYHQGILALAAWLAALGCSAGKWLRSDRPASAICGAAILCYCIQAFFSFSMCSTAPFMWCIWGLLESSHRPIEIPPTPERKTKGRK